MPFYEYQCTACGHRLEVLQKISDAPLRDCAECGAQGDAGLKKLISKSAFRLKGGGWYETDFKGGGSASGNKSAGSDTSTQKADSKATSDTKAKSDTAKTA